MHVHLPCISSPNIFEPFEAVLLNSTIAVLLSKGHALTVSTKFQLIMTYKCNMHGHMYTQSKSYFH